MRLTEATLERAIDRHAQKCLTCLMGEDCEEPGKIEAAYWNEVDWQIDEYRERED